MARGKKAQPPAATNADQAAGTIEQLNLDAAAEEAGGEQTVTGDGTGAPLPEIEEEGGERAAEAPQAEATASEEDHITAFERRVDRLMEIVEEAEFESGTLVGDIRDTNLEIFKNRPKAWSQLSAGEQGDIVRALEAAAKKVLRKLVIVIAEEDDVSVHATLKGYAVDGDTFKLKVVAKGDEETAAELFRMDGHEVIMIRADARQHHGQRKDAEIQPDQPGLVFSDGGAPKEIVSTPPADNSDLAEAGGPEPTEEVEDDPPEVTVLDKLDVNERVNVKTGMIERALEGGENGDFEDVREATAEELAAERERTADFEV